ncbi:hypothetical protein [Actinoplanes sp. NPDC049118]|uniref:hypothetical protein n=1 Tax=Actinoplanes sp. NPDC049118 TaxID=3155769 RepID=UPI00340409D9
MAALIHEPPAGPLTTDVLRYLDVLPELDLHSAAVNTALLEAHTALTPPQCRAALTDLHTRLRIMAATANSALGGWPEQDEGSR